MGLTELSKKAIDSLAALIDVIKDDDSQRIIFRMIGEITILTEKNKEVIPPKDKEEEESESESSEDEVVCYDDGSSSEEVPLEDEEDDEEEEASFIDDSDPVVYSKKVYDAYEKQYQEKPPSKKRGRNRQKPKKFDPSEYSDKYYQVESIDSEDDIPAQVNIDGLQILKEKLLKSKNKYKTLCENKWFLQQFGDVIDEVQNQLGNDSKQGHQQALDNFTSVIENIIDGKECFNIEKNDLEITSCSFCGENKPCEYCIVGKRSLGCVSSRYYVGSSCVRLMENVIAFFECLSNYHEENHVKHFKKLKDLLSNIVKGNVKKKHRGEDPEEKKKIRRGKRKR